MMITLSALLLTGCAFEENLPEKDFDGTVRIPVAATQFSYQFGETDDDVVDVDDSRGLGPVYLGAFPAVQEGLYNYTHPEIGPILNTSQDGNTYPYGGTSIGRFDWGCYQSLVCKVVSGRFATYDDVLEYFADSLNDPVLDGEGTIVEGGVEFQEHCFDVLYYAADYEVTFIGETDFTLDGDHYVANVTLPHTTYAEGMSVWGWMDMPSPSGNFSTCDEGTGEFHSYYAEEHYLGASVNDLLNFPGKYIDSGDWVVQDAAIINGPDDSFDLELGYHYVDE
jgi:hypothetical protein